MPTTRPLEGRVEELTRKVLEIERRLSALERSSVAPPERAAPPSPSLATAEGTEPELAGAMSLFGRTLLTFGGAYLLRAVTEAGALPQALGVFFGLLYACAWIVLAHRAASSGRTASASFYIGSAVLIGYPILWEATVRLQILGPGGSASALVGFTILPLVVARRWKLSSATWVTLLAADATALVLLFGTRAVVPFAAALVVFAFAGLSLGYARGWPQLQWVTAVFADLAVVMLTIGVAIPNANVSVPAAVSVQLLLLLAYFGSFFWRSAMEKKVSGRFEMIQGAAATLIGYGGAAITATGFSRVSAIGLGIAAALVCYGSAFRWLRMPEVRTNGLFFSGLGSALVLLATGPASLDSAYVWGILAVLAFALGSSEAAFRHHGSIYLLAAAVASRLFLFTAYALAAPAEVAWLPLSLPMLVVLAAAVISCGVDFRAHYEWKSGARLPRLLALSIAFSGGGAVLMLLLTPALAGSPGDSIDAALLATLRTAVLGLAAIGLGALGGGTKLREAVWLAYGVLALSGIKLVVEDFPRGRAPTLFLGLLAYGTALILAPRFVRSLR